jgi:hypothetical protein
MLPCPDAPKHGNTRLMAKKIRSHARLNNETSGEKYDDPRGTASTLRSVKRPGSSMLRVRIRLAQASR